MLTLLRVFLAIFNHLMKETGFMIVVFILSLKKEPIYVYFSDRKIIAPLTTVSTASVLRLYPKGRVVKDCNE